MDKVSLINKLLDEGTKEAAMKGYDVTTSRGHVMAATAASIQAMNKGGIELLEAVQKAARKRWKDIK